MLSHDPKHDLEKIRQNLLTKTPFTFVRFSDGEIEILRNRYLKIAKGETVFRGAKFSNQFPIHDQKVFDPMIHADLRADLLSSACYTAQDYFKGIPTTHNRALADREFLLRLNGGMDDQITFSDLLVNSNYQRFLQEVVPTFSNFADIYVVANYRAKLQDELAEASLVSVPDNFFANYARVKADVLFRLSEAPIGALILMSASSLTNVIGHELRQRRDDLTLIDVGTSLNHLLALGNTREYHQPKQKLFGDFGAKVRDELVW